MSMYVHYTQYKYNKVHSILRIHEVQTRSQLGPNMFRHTQPPIEPSRISRLKHKPSKTGFHETTSNKTKKDSDNDTPKRK